MPSTSSSWAALGHKPTCPFIDNFGPSCDCDGAIATTDEAAAIRKQIVEAMELGGWTSDPSAFWLSFSRRHGDHVISIVRVHSGWQVNWIRRPGLTIMEQRNFGSVTACLVAFYEDIISWNDLARDLRTKVMEAASDEPAKG